MDDMDIESLLMHGEFKSHSGILLPWKFEVELATDDDCLAFTRALNIPHMYATGIYSGGTYILHHSEDITHFHTTKCIVTTFGCDTIIVDDVVTTGQSILEAKQQLEPQGYRVKGIVCVLDRRPEIKRLGHDVIDLPIRSLFTSLDGSIAGIQRTHG